MQYLDNDMDELFNKAGNDYPLRTDVPDFDGVLGKLNPGVASKPNYRKYLLLLLLLPVGYLMNNSLNKKAVVNPPVANPLPETTNSTFSKGREQTREPENVYIDNAKYPGIRTQNSRFSQIFRLHPVRANSYSIPPESEVGWTSRGSDISSARNGRLTAPKINYSYEKPIISFPNLSTGSSSSNPVKKSKQKSSFYVGIIAGPDISTVKYQSIKNLGFSIGILGGYKFSKHWSAETGLIYNNKKYYTDGKYFDKTKSGIPASVYVESLDGSCNMFEVPVSVRYDFSTNKNRFFATLGATSYFMKKEKYTYDAYASGGSYKGHRSYNNSGNHLFSNMQFSVGYNRQLSNKINLRIEPYIKVPIRYIGIGNLPITSSGIYFSVMQSIK